MKKLVICVTLVVCACSPNITHIPKETFYFGIDFTKYSEKGFLITPETYSGEYQSVGLVNYVILPAANYVAVKSYLTGQGTTEMTYEWKVDQIDVTEGLDSLYTIARRMGANAIINFKTNSEVREYGFVVNPVKVTGYELTGFAIRRKGN